MSKSLKIIQVVSKIAMILSLIAFIGTCIGFGGCLIGLLCFAVVGAVPLSIKGMSLYGFIEVESGESVGSVFAAMTVGAVICAGTAVVLFLSYLYFKKLVKKGNPFDEEMAKGMFRLGLYSIIIPLCTVIVAAIIHAIFDACFDGVRDMHFDNGSGFVTGVFMLILSVVFRYGSEVAAGSAGEAAPCAGEQKPAAAIAEEKPAESQEQ